MLASCLERVSRMAVMVSVPALAITCWAYCVLASRAVSKPKALSCCRAWVTCGLCLLSVMRCMPAFSKKGLYFAMTATVSM